MLATDLQKMQNAVQAEGIPYLSIWLGGHGVEEEGEALEWRVDVAALADVVHEYPGDLPDDPQARADYLADMFMAVSGELEEAVARMAVRYGEDVGTWNPPQGREDCVGEGVVELFRRAEEVFSVGQGRRWVFNVTLEGAGMCWEVSMREITRKGSPIVTERIRYGVSGRVLEHVLEKFLRISEGLI